MVRYNTKVEYSNGKINNHLVYEADLRYRYF